VYHLADVAGEFDAGMPQNHLSSQLRYFLAASCLLHHLNGRAASLEAPEQAGLGLVCPVLVMFLQLCVGAMLSLR